MTARGEFSWLELPKAFALASSHLKPCSWKGDGPLPKKYPAARLAAGLRIAHRHGPRRGDGRRNLVAAQSTGTTFLAASNTEPAFDFMTQDFVQTANGGQQRHVQFRRLGEARRGDRRRGRLRIRRCRQLPRRLALFASADEANVDNTIPAGTPPRTTRARCRRTASASASTRTRRRTPRPTAATITARRAPVSGRPARSTPPGVS